MIYCKNCGKQLPDEAKFCDGCGQATAQPMAAPAAAEPVAVSEPVAPVAPVAAAEPDAPVAVAEPVAPVAPVAAAEPVAPVAPVAAAEPVAPAAKKFDFGALLKNTKLLIFGGAGLALLTVIVIVISIFAGNGKTPGYALYFKDEEMQFTFTSKIKPFEVTEDLMDDGTISTTSAALFTVMSEDGKTLFYADRIDAGDSGYNLYYRNVKKPKAEPERIDSNVVSYIITSDNAVVYKSSDGELYKHNLKEKTRIAKDVSSYTVSEDGKHIYFVDDEKRLYYITGKKDKEKLEGDITNLYGVDEKGTTVYYIKNATLYKRNIKKDREKIAKDVYSVAGLFQSGEVYYYKEDTKKVKVSDYVFDDMKEEDADLTEPLYPEYPSFSDFDNYDDWQVAYDKYTEDLDNYNDNINDYEEKLARDELRDELKDATVKVTTYTLYYFDGKKEKKVADNLASTSSAETENPIILINEYKEGKDVETVNLSDIYSISDVTYDIESSLRGSSVTRLVVKADVVKFASDKVKNVQLTEDCKTICYTTSNDEGELTLYKAALKGSKLGDAEKVDKKVSGYQLSDDGKVYYFKDVKDNEGDLYCDGEIVDYDVRSSISFDIDENGKVYYATDYDDGEYTLKVWNGKKPAVVAEEVRTAYMLPDGNMLCLVDYSTKSKSGDLMMYNGKKLEKIDEDVSGIIPIYESSYGYCYR